MARKIVAGNWKMNLSLEEALALIKGIDFEGASNLRVLVFPSSIYIPSLKAKTQTVEIGVQNFSANENGAFTGEVSIPQLQSCGVNIGLIGHSERRILFGESNEMLKAKVDLAIKYDFEFIFCCGEPLEVRDQGNELDFVKNQLEASLFHLTEEQLAEKTIAYEPVWAIGTGRTATNEQVAAMHSAIRTWLIDRYGPTTGNSVTLLYGGSCNASNAKALFACENVDGGLIGGASLKAESFNEIIKAI